MNEEILQIHKEYYIPNCPDFEKFIEEKNALDNWKIGPDTYEGRSEKRTWREIYEQPIEVSTKSCGCVLTVVEYIGKVFLRFKFDIEDIKKFYQTEESISIFGDFSFTIFNPGFPKQVHRLKIWLTKENKEILHKIDVRQFPKMSIGFSFNLRKLFSLERVFQRMFRKADHTDRTLVVEGKKIHVKKQFLSAQSEFFRALFSTDLKEGEMTEITLHDATYDNLCHLLAMVYPAWMFPLEYKLPEVLQLADKFLVKRAKDRIEQHMLNTNNFRTDEKLLMGERASCEELYLITFCGMTKEDAKEIQKSEYWEYYSKETKERIKWKASLDHSGYRQIFGIVDRGVFGVKFLAL